MIAGTAHATASIHIRLLDYTSAPTQVPDDLEQDIRSLVQRMRRLSDYKLEASIHMPSPINPQWFANLQNRIRASVKPNYRNETSDGRWISQEVADAASAFFQKTADLLPGEPFIYSSRLGDLVAEFKGERGTMTGIVSPTFVLLFAVIDGVPVERTVFENSNMRGEVQRLAGMLHTGQHVAVDTLK